MILLIDNYDSFVHNLARYFARLGQPTRVVRNDALSVAEIARQLHRTVPLLGVCLGHQAIGMALGARIVRAAEPRHGRTSLVEHESSVLFRGLPRPMVVGRYHSLVVAESPWPSALRITARSDDGQIMALEHRQLPVMGVQFHPESILTQGGFTLLANFLRHIGLSVRDPEPLAAGEWRRPVEVATPVNSTPITF